MDTGSIYTRIFISADIIFNPTGNSGLGEESILQLAKHTPEKIYLAARSKEKADNAIARLKKIVPDAAITYLPLDLTSLRSVKDAADIVNAGTTRLDILMNNAGIMAVPAALTQDGYEIQFGTNHVGHALLTKLLLPKLEATTKLAGADVRIINVSSAGHVIVPKGGIVFDQLRTDMKATSTFTRYGQSKLANVLLTKELAERYPAIRSIVVHPGAVQTGLTQGIVASWGWTKTLVNVMGPLVQKSTADGALNQLWAAASNDGKSGCYYDPVAKEVPASAYCRDKELAAKLWEWTEKELDQFLAEKK